MANGTQTDYRKTFHPNRITASSLGFSIAGLGLMQGGGYYDVLGLGLIGVGQVLDAVDGRLARKWNMRTMQGAKLDPLTDKARFFLTGVYTAASDITNGGIFYPLSVAANLVVDGISQRARGDLSKQVEEAYEAVVNPDKGIPDTQKESSVRANGYGKAKAAIQSICGLTYLGMEVAKNHYGNLPEMVQKYTPVALGVALVSSATLGAIGIMKRRKSRSN